METMPRLLLLFALTLPLCAEGTPCAPEPTDMLISPGDLIACQVEVKGDVDVFRFTAAAGQAVRVSAARSGGTTGRPCLTLYGPDGNQITDRCPTWSEDLYVKVDAKLTKTGIHAVHVREDGNNETMSYVFSLERTAPPSSSAPTLRSGQGVHTDLDPVGDVDAHAVSGAAGDTIVFTASRVSGTGRPCVALIDPDGTVLSDRCPTWSEDTYTRVSGKLRSAGAAAVLVYEEGFNQTLSYRGEPLCVGPYPGPEGPLAVSSPSVLSGGVAGRAYWQPLSTSGGKPRYHWAVTAGALPGGLQLDAHSGIIVGIPTAAGVFNFTVQVTDESPATASQAFSLTIGASGAMVESSACAAEPTDMLIWPGELRTCQLEIQGDMDVFRFAGLANQAVRISAARQGATGGRPCLSVYGFDGTLLSDRCPTWSGETFVKTDVKLTKSGTYFIHVWEEGNNETLTYALAFDRAAAPPAAGALQARSGMGVDADLNPVGDADGFSINGGAGDTVTATATRQSGTGRPCVALIDPDGTVLSDRCPTWAEDVFTKVSGKLRSAGPATLVVYEEGFNEAITYRMDVQCVGVCGAAPAPPAITTGAPLPNGAVGVSYSQFLVATEGAPPYRWSVSSGTLPSGFSLNAATGALTGTPTASGTFAFTVQVTDSLGAAATKAFTLTIAGVSISVSRTSLVFAYQAGDPPPAPQTVALSGTAGLSFTANASTSSGGNWLAVNPAAGAVPATLTVSVNPAALNVGVYSGTVTITAGATVQRLAVQLFVNRPDGPPQVFSVVNAATLAPGPVAPGEIATLFGANLGPATLVNFQLNEDQLTATLAETQVLFDNIPAPLIYVMAGQVSAIVPFAVAGTTEVRVQVQQRGLKSNVVIVPVATAAPGLFTMDSSGKGPAAIHNQNYTVNSASNPAEKGSVVILWATGGGETDPQVADGRLASPEVLPRPKLPMTVRIGGLDAEVLYAGSAPGMVVGLLQVNVRVPDGVASGAVPVLLSVAGVASPPDVTLAVR